MSTSIAIALVSCPSADAPRLARALVEARVAACVNMLPAVRSIYRWQDTIEDETETLLLVKHPANGFEALKAIVLQHHPYELPEVIAVPVHSGHAPYLDWVIASCT